MVGVVGIEGFILGVFGAEVFVKTLYPACTLGGLLGL